MKDLIARVEGLTGPSREVDAAIHGSVHWPRLKWEVMNIARHGDEFGKWMVLRHTVENYGVLIIPPDYTSSIEAALTLVPEGWYGRVEPRFYSEYDKFEKRIVLWNAYCIYPRWEDATPVNDDYFDVHGNSESHAHPAIALCIAALRARAALKARLEVSPPGEPT